MRPVVDNRAVLVTDGVKLVVSQRVFLLVENVAHVRVERKVELRGVTHQLFMNSWGGAYQELT